MTKGHQAEVLGPYQLISCFKDLVGQFFNEDRKCTLVGVVNNTRFGTMTTSSVKCAGETWSRGDEWSLPLRKTDRFNCETHRT